MSPSSQPPKRIGFYPVSAHDYMRPLHLLKGHVEHLIFCDIWTSPHDRGRLERLREVVQHRRLPEPHFILGDALAAMRYLRPVDVFFLRRDSGGEGGSGLFLLGEERLAQTLAFIKPGGLLITDERNGREWFRAMTEGELATFTAGERTLRLKELVSSEREPLAIFSVACAESEPREGT